MDLYSLLVALVLVQLFHVFVTDLGHVHDLLQLLLVIYLSRGGLVVLVLTRLGKRFDQVSVNIIFQDVAEIIRLVEPNLLIEVPLIKILRQELLFSRDVLVEDFCVKLLHGPQSMLPHFEEVFLILDDGLKDVVNDRVRIVDKFFASLDLAKVIPFLNQLEQPRVLWLLNLYFPDGFEFWIDSNPKYRTLVIVSEQFLSLKVVLELIIFIL